MKKSFIFMFAALAAVSCAKELEDNQVTQDGITYKEITFDALATKTTINGTTGAVAWEQGDEISIYYVDATGKSATAVATATEAGSTSKFKALIPDTDNPDCFYAAYPKESGILTITEATDEADATVSFSLEVGNPEKLDGTFKSANFAASYTTAASKSFEFKNAVGIVKVTLPEGGIISHDGVDYTVDGMYLRGQATGFVNRGTVTVNVADGKISGFGDASGKSNITIDALSAEAKAAGVVYLPTPPGTWENGITVRWISEKGSVPAVLSQDKAINVDRGEIISLEDVSSKIVWDYYVSVEGTGDGITAPMSLADFQYLLKETSNTYKDDGITGYMYKCLLLNGTTFHFADGTYELTETLTFPAPLEQYTITLEGTPGSVILDGGTVSTGTGDTRATVTQEGVKILQVSLNTHVTLKGLILQNGYAANGAAIDVAFTSESTDANSTLDCVDCQLLNNISSSHGGAILIRNAAAGGIIRFDNCYFKDNQTTGNSAGGTLYTADGKTAALFNKCSFYKNKGKKNGIDIYMNNASARLGINNCTFNAYNPNKNKEEISNGSIITNKGYTVIANSNVWNSGYVYDGWGSIALGAAAAGNGSMIVNSVVRQASTKPAFYLNGNYSQNISYCIYTGAVEASGATKDETYFITDSYNLEIAGSFDTPTGKNGTTNTVPYYYYTWKWVDGYPCPTLKQVKDAISGTAEIGPLFLAWLESLDGALTTDIAGNQRNENAMCPGSYQQTDTPTSGSN